MNLGILKSITFQHMTHPNCMCYGQNELKGAKKKSNPKIHFGYIDIIDRICLHLKILRFIVLYLKTHLIYLCL